MPTSYVKKIAKKHHTSVGKSENVWEAAKRQASKQGKGENFAYVTSIYKTMMGEDAKELSLKGFLQVTERMSDIGDVSYSSHDDFDDEDDQLDDYELDGEDELGLDDEEDFEGDDEFPEDDDEFGDEDLEGHDGHQLADVIGDDELNDEDEFPEDEDEFGEDEFPEDEDGEFDEDEFPEDEFPGGDEMPDENGEFPPEDEDRYSKFREGHEMKGSFLQELMFISEKAKKKPLKKAAKAVYHRDYEKTKKKPYRKYHPEYRDQE